MKVVATSYIIARVAREAKGAVTPPTFWAAISGPLSKNYH